MTTRTITKQVVFRRPFLLTGFEKVQAAGTYSVDTDEELMDSVSLPVWRRTATTLRLEQMGAVEYVPVEPEELAKALLRDGAQPEIMQTHETAPDHRRKKRDVRDINRVLGKRS